MVEVEGTLGSTVFLEREPRLNPKFSPRPWKWHLKCCPAWNREATSNRAFSMCCPNRCESCGERHKEA